MASVLTVTFGEGDIAQQLYTLKISAIKNHDVPALWRLTETLVELALKSAHPGQWPAGYVTDSRLFDVPLDFVRESPHLLCEDYVIYPYIVKPPQILHA
jgi:hypothetical protein